MISIIDTKFRKNAVKYILQCFLATFTILVVLLFLDVLNETAIITALGASAFITFTTPNRYSSHPRRLLGGYAVGLSIGLILYILSVYLQHLISQHTLLIAFGAIAVGTSTFFMAITNTEHAPAAGIALGLVINRWDHITILFIIVAILWMAGIRKLLRPFLIDLTSPLKRA